ncbi:uncharacterized protein YjaG (DUF416 family) [Bacillus fengqiuensis]|nr:uncharacterized protein YjaG (DUF416 family) [Bacillus fengqiuensis]
MMKNEHVTDGWDIKWYSERAIKDCPLRRNKKEKGTYE